MYRRKRERKTHETKSETRETQLREPGVTERRQKGKRARIQ